MKQELDWAAYSLQISDSRELIARPFIERQLNGKQGIGLDIGCGDGALTERIASALPCDIIGIDIDDTSLARARKIGSKLLHFAKFDLERSHISDLGIRCDFAFSNCCFTQISDDAVHRTLLSLHSCLQTSSEVVFLVPHLTWAADHYTEIQHRYNGFSAIPRYGGRQIFRIPSWYIAALAKNGFESILHVELVIPDDARLEPRYRTKAGRPLFSAFVARKSEKIPDKDVYIKAFDTAHENRKLEIGLFWQRSLFFWGFVAAALVGYATSYAKSTGLSFVFSLFGLVCSVVWSCGNRGSKYWQEYWEKKVSHFQHHATGNIFDDRTPALSSAWKVFAPRRISVSKLTMALSDYTVGIWIILCVVALREPLRKLIVENLASFPPAVQSVYVDLRESSSTLLPPLLMVVTLFYCLWCIRSSKSED